jgi:hypothetical protein
VSCSPRRVRSCTPEHAKAGRGSALALLGPDAIFAGAAASSLGTQRQSKRALPNRCSARHGHRACRKNGCTCIDGRSRPFASTRVKGRECTRPVEPKLTCPADRTEDHPAELREAPLSPLRRYVAVDTGVRRSTRPSEFDDRGRPARRSTSMVDNRCMRQNLLARGSGTLAPHGHVRLTPRCAGLCAPGSPRAGPQDLRTRRSHVPAGSLRQ